MILRVGGAGCDQLDGFSMAVHIRAARSLPPSSAPPSKVAFMADLEADLLDLVAAEGLVDRALLTPEARLEDLGLQSIDLVTIVFAIEDRYGVALELEIFNAAKTVADLMAVVVKGVSESPAAATVATS